MFIIIFLEIMKVLIHTNGLVYVYHTSYNDNPIIIDGKHITPNYNHIVISGLSYTDYFTYYKNGIIYTFNKVYK